MQGQPINGGGDAAVRNTKEEYGKLCIPVPGDDAQVQRHNTLGMQYTLCTVLPKNICICELFSYSSMRMEKYISQCTFNAVHKYFFV